MEKKAVDIPADTPEWLAEVLLHGAALDSTLLGTVKAMLFAMRVVIATHPEPAALRREWHARKHPELDEAVESLFSGPDETGRRAYLKALAALERQVDQRAPSRD